MGTGLGGESYAIIGQERIGQLLSADLHDRRSIIEKAAGITRFKNKKRLAELRLEAAKQNLSRVNDIFEEVARQMTTLKRQAAKAERYGALRDELRTKPACRPRQPPLFSSTPNRPPLGRDLSLSAAPSTPRPPHSTQWTPSTPGNRKRLPAR